MLLLFSCLPQCSCLCVSEINRVRKDMYSDTVNGLVDRHPLELPEPIGPIVHLQEKLFVPVKEYPDVSSCFTHLTLLQLHHCANNVGACALIILEVILKVFAHQVQIQTFFRMRFLICHLMKTLHTESEN